MAITAAATGLVVGAVLGPSTAQAAPVAAADPTSITATDAIIAAADALGASAAGVYLDRSTGLMMVNVTTTAAATAVRGVGAVPRFVQRSGAELNAAVAELDRSARIVGTAWAIDPISNQVVVSIDESVTGTKLAAVNAVVARLGSAVRLERVAGTFSTTISGGQAIYGGNSRCSLGFNVRNSSGTRYFLTAGHCTNIASTWYANSSHTTVLGSRTGSSFPGNDYGIVRYTNTSISTPGNVYLWPGTRDMTGSGNAFVGQSAQRSGSTTGLRSGSVTATNATVTYPQGTVSGLIRTNICAEGGDSGGSLFAGNTALGLTSGGSGNCTFGGTTYFQPVTEPLGVYGVSIY